MRQAWLGVALVVFLAAVPSHAGDPKIPHERYRLPNGMEVILVPDSRVPIIEVNVWYHVGAQDETMGRSGFAHLFEHMMFQGTAHTEEDAHFKILERVGASDTNGSTNNERTNYYEQVPAHQVETALWLESERMGFLLPGIDEKSLENQRQVVRNERRQSLEIQPYSVQYLELHKMLYPEGHPYRHTVIGKHEDIQAATAGDVKGFFKKWYAPANSTLCLAGDFQPETMKKTVEKWFGDFPSSTKPAHRAIPAPVAKAQRATVSDPYAKLRKVHYAWHTPSLYAPGDAELDILAFTLGAPGTGRLYRALVLEKQLAHNVAVYQESRQLSSIFHIEIDLKTGADMAQAEKIAQDELERAARELITKRELDRAVTNWESGYIWGLERLHARCELLQLYNHYTGDPDGITRDLDRYRKATADGVRDAASRFLPRSRRIELVTMPEEKR